MRLKQAREMFLICYKEENHILANYAMVSNDFISYIGNIETEILTANNLREYMAFRPSMAYYLAVRVWLRWCYLNGLMDGLQTKFEVPLPIRPVEIDELFLYLHNRPFFVNGRYPSVQPLV